MGGEMKLSYAVFCCLGALAAAAAAETSASSIPLFKWAGNSQVDVGASDSTARWAQGRRDGDGVPPPRGVLQGAPRKVSRADKFPGCAGEGGLVLFLEHCTEGPGLGRPSQGRP